MTTDSVLLQRQQEQGQGKRTNETCKSRVKHWGSGELRTLQRTSKCSLFDSN